MYPPWSLIKRAALSGVPRLGVGRLYVGWGLNDQRVNVVRAGMSLAADADHWLLRVFVIEVWKLLTPRISLVDRCCVYFIVIPPSILIPQPGMLHTDLCLSFLVPAKCRTEELFLSYAPMPGVKIPRYVTGMPIIDPGITYLFGVSVLMFLNTRIRARC